MREISYNKDYVKLDGGFYFAQGVFETILIKEEAVFLEEHINRLNKSIDIMGLGEHIDIKFIKNFIKEEKLKNILSQIEGAGEVDVMITYESSEEIQPAFNTNTTTEETKEVDQQGGERTVTTSSENKTMITSSSNEPIVIKTNQPKINGVIVVATGAKDLTVKETLYSAVQTALQVQGHQVEIYTK